MAVEIRKSVIEAQIEAGMKKKELAEHYELPMTQMTKVLQQLGLRIKQNHHPKFVIVDDTVTEATESVVDISEIPTSQVLEAVVDTAGESEW